MVVKKDGAKTPENGQGKRKVTKATPIKIMKKDTSLREQGLKILARFYIGEMDLELIKRRALYFEKRQLTDEEAVLAVLTELIRNTDDPQLKAKQMEAVAEFQSLCGMDPRPVLAEMHKMELSIFKELGFEAVTIECHKGACSTCRTQKGKKMKIDEVLIRMPLPHPSCSTRPNPKAAPFCRCRYYGEYIG